MSEASGNFEFLKKYDDRVARLARQAERYVHTDPDSCLFKLRLMVEVMARALVEMQLPHLVSGDLSTMLRGLQRSGLLQRKVGGSGVRPYDLKVSFKPINPDRAPNVYRRSLYTFWKRTAPSPVMMTFDSSKKDVCMVRRERTDSASQSLVLLNGPQFLEAARATAHKLVEEFGKEKDGELVAHAFRLLTSTCYHHTHL